MKQNVRKNSAKILCPFCDREFDACAVHFRFVIGDAVRYLSADPNNEDTRDFLKKIGCYANLTVSDRIPVKMLIYTRSGQQRFVSSFRVCQNENCHRALSPNAGKYSFSDTIFMIGLKSSGKTVYIASVIKRLEEILPKHFSCIINAYNKDVADEYKMNYHDVIFRDQRLPDATIKEAQLTYEIQNNRSRKVVGVSFSDIKGELSTDVEKLQENAQTAIRNASRYILTVDLNDPSVDTDINTIITQTFGNIIVDEEKRNNSYLAIVVTKSDSLANKFDPIFERTASGASKIYSNIFYSNKENFEQERSDINRKLRNYMHKRCPNAMTSAETIFLDGHVNYFAVSALGQSPEKGRVMGNLNPLRVEEPIIWLLQNSEILDWRSGKI